MPMDEDDDRLLDIPLANLLPGELARAFQVHAKFERKHEDEKASLRTAQLLKHSEIEQQERERADRDFQTREAILLQHIHQQQEELQLEAEELDERTLKLADGRRAYVDGHDFRDEHGTMMAGADRAEAEQLHLSNPSAATWQERQQLERRRRDLDELNRKAEAIQAGTAGQNQSEELSKLECQVKAQQVMASSLPDYESAASLDFSTLSANFNQTMTGKKRVETAPSLRLPTTTTAPSLTA